MILKIKPPQQLLSFLLFVVLFISNTHQQSNSNSSPLIDFSYFNNYYDPHNASAYLINATNGTNWGTPPNFYNGTSYFDGENTWPCVNLTNGSNGTNCSMFYGGAALQGYYSPSTVKCQAVLLQSYGFTGYIMANQSTYPLCPNIEYSCCSSTDIFQAFQTFAHDGIQHNLINRMNYFNNSYIEYMYALNDADSLIGIISSKINVTNNCKVLANAIEPFNVGDVVGFMMTIIRDYFAFHSQNFESFYCTLCDGQLQPYFDLTRQQIVFSHRHCKNMVESTLVFLLYFHDHFVKFNNLIVDFMASCDMYGQFTSVVIDESLYKLQIDHELHNNLLRCKKERDGVHWYKACLFICRHYSMTKLDDFFLPNIRKITSIASFIRMNLQILQNQALSEIESDAYIRKARSERMLETVHLETGLDDSADKRNLQQSHPARPYNFLIMRTLGLSHLETLMIPNALNGKVDLSQLGPTFHTQGIISANITQIMSFDQVTYDRTFALYVDTLKFNSVALSIHIGGLNSGAVNSLSVGLAYLVGIVVTFMSI